MVRDANKRLDDERKVAEEVYFALKGRRIKIPKRPLMTGRERLSGRKKQEVEEILSQYDNIKERIRSLYRVKTYQEAEKELLNIIEEMKTYKMWPALKRWQRYLKDRKKRYQITSSQKATMEK